MRKILILICTLMAMKSYSQSGPSVVKDVDLKKYQGTWYEIARLPNSFEKNLKCITATYSIRSDGRIKVLNRGHRIIDPSRESTAEGVAWVPDSKDPGKLKVRFFWPFSGNYWIIELDKDYNYVLVGDPSFRYLWILCRTKVMDEKTFESLLLKARKEGFDTSNIIKVEHDCTQ